MHKKSVFDTGRIFFLGAGFSAGAGLPLTNSLLPLAASLFKSESPGLFKRISWWADSVDVDLAAKPSAEQFARFCTFLDFMELREFAGGERWSDEGSRERVALKFYLAKAIAMATPDANNIPDYYIDFARDLKPGDVVVTFNWDTLLENVLSHVRKPYLYNGSVEAVQILKMHGSVNWIQKLPTLRPQRDLFDYQPLALGADLTSDGGYFSQRLNFSKNWETCRAMVDGVWPLLVLPGYGKAVDVRLLSTLWYRPEMLNLYKGGVSIIGLSVGDDDYIMDGLFRYLFRNVFSDQSITVVNPDDSVAAKFDALTGPDIKVNFVPSQFDENSLRTALLRT